MVVGDYKRSRLERFFRDPLIGEEVLRSPYESEACRNIRIALRYLGYGLAENKQYDEELAEGVLSFQTDNSHSSRDGYVGPGTRRLLTQKLIERVGERPFSVMKHPEGELFPQIFLSYAQEDFESARRLFNDLKALGVNIWFDKESLLPGQNWRVAITGAIKRSRYFLAVLSGNSVTKKGYVQKEMKHALEVVDEYPETEIFLIPVRLNAC
jgi:hypothetical protein